MSWLFGAFLLGGLAVAFPLLFHLIRRTPKGQQAFSSLMFLKPSPPRLTRRSRLDDLLLLLLRALAILLLAAAFTRPYWRAAAELSLDNVRGRRVAIVLDTSASMRRGKLWNQAIERAEKTLATLSPADDVALFTFDRDVGAIIGFDEQTPVERGQKPALVKGRLAELSPSWNPTNLGEALVRVAEVLDESGDDNADVSLQVVLITDLQNGSTLEALQVFEWPEQIRVAIEQVALPDNSNATVQLLDPTDDEEPTAEPLVRVTNAADSRVEQFQVHWAADATNPGEHVVPFYVPPGQSRVLRVPRQEQALAASRLIVSGDPAVFDNTQYVVPVRQQVLRLAYLGSDDRNDPEAMRFYLERALGETPQRKVEFTALGPADSLTLLPAELPQLMVVTGALSPAQSESVGQYVTGGGTTLVVLSREALTSYAALLPNVSLDEKTFPADENDFRLLGEIDFTHRLFATFANPRYNDFTGIRFWNYCPVQLNPTGEDDSAAEQPQMIARFDNGKPALWQQQRGQGTFYVLAAGWHPSESQFALSNKFVPFMEELLELCTPRTLAATSYTVGDTIGLPEFISAESRKVIGPAGNETEIAARATSFTEAHEPGIYTLQMSGEQHAFAVNLARSESDTVPLEPSQLEQFGVKLGMQATQAEEYERLRQLRDVELEHRQKFWKWLIVAALCVLALETGVAAWRGRRISIALGETA